MDFQQAKSFLVGGWRVKPDEDTVTRDGHTERLEPLAMQVLVHLASRAGEVVSRDELEQAVWKGGVVSYDSVTSTVIKLRKALGDNARKPSYIATIPKRGYQLVAPVSPVLDEQQAVDQTEDPALSGLPRKRRATLLFAVLAAVAALVWGVLNQWQPPPAGPEEHRTERTNVPPSIVVLPFANMSGDVEQEYFSDGMTEDLLTDLSKIPTLTVIARTSAFAYRGDSPDIPAIADALGVSHVVLGSVRKADGRVRINVKLVDAETGKHVWAERYDRELKDIFALQDEVRAKIVSTLAVTLSASDEQHAAAKTTQSVEAYELLMKGRYQATSFTREGNAEAIGLYERAIEIDPGYARAYARLANMYELRSQFGWGEDADADTNMALKLARKAIALDETNPFSHWTLGRIYSRVRPGGIKNLFDAVESLERALELDPNYADAHAFISHLYVGIGKPDKALAAIASAIRLNPQYPFWYIRNRGLIQFFRGDHASAIADLEQALEKNPTTFISRYWLAAAYAEAGRQDDADWQIEELGALGFDSDVQEVLDVSNTYHPPYLRRLRANLRKAGVPE